MKSLNDLEQGESATILGFADNAIASKLISMGVYMHATVLVFNKTIRGHAMYVTIGSLNLALLKSEAATIQISNPH